MAPAPDSISFHTYQPWEPSELRILKAQLAKVECNCEACIHFREKSAANSSPSKIENNKHSNDIVNDEDNFAPLLEDATTTENTFSYSFHNNVICPTCDVIFNILRNVGINIDYKDQEIEAKPSSISVNSGVNAEKKDANTFCEFKFSTSQLDMKSASNTTLDKMNGQEKVSSISSNGSGVTTEMSSNGSRRVTTENNETAVCGDVYRSDVDLIDLILDKTIGREKASSNSFRSSESGENNCTPAICDVFTSDFVTDQIQQKNIEIKSSSYTLFDETIRKTDSKELENISTVVSHTEQPFKVSNVNVQTDSLESCCTCQLNTSYTNHPEMKISCYDFIIQKDERTSLLNHQNDFASQTDEESIIFANQKTGPSECFLNDDDESNINDSNASSTCSSNTDYDLKLKKIINSPLINENLFSLLGLS